MPFSSAIIFPATTIVFFIDDALRLTNMIKLTNPQNVLCFSGYYLLMGSEIVFCFFMLRRKKWTCKFAHGKCVAKMNKLSSNSGAKMVNAKFTYNNTRGFK